MESRASKKRRLEPTPSPPCIDPGTVVPDFPSMSTRHSSLRTYSKTSTNHSKSTLNLPNPKSILRNPRSILLDPKTTVIIPKPSLNDPETTLNSPKACQTEVTFSTLNFCCDHCGATYLSKASLNNHMVTNHLSEPTLDQCEFCPKIFGSDVELKNHQTSAHFSYLRCYICSELSPSLPELKSHCRASHGAMSLSTLEKRLFHYTSKKVSILKKLDCIVCNQIFTSKSDLCDHVLLDHYKITGSFCSFCNCSFKTRSDLTKHLLFAHHAMISSLHNHIKQILEFKITKHKSERHLLLRIASKFFYKTSCFEKFDSLTEILKHFEQHHESILQCDVCTYRVQSGTLNSLTKVKLALKRVQVESCMQDMLGISNMEPSALYKCKKCNSFCFPDKMGLRHHVLDVHHKFRRFRCAYCSKEFYSTENVQQHFAKYHPNKIECLQTNVSPLSVNYIAFLESNPTTDLHKLFHEEFLSEIRSIWKNLRSESVEYSCDKCSVIFPCEEDYRQHTCMRRTYRCLNCAYASNTVRKMTYHFKQNSCLNTNTQKAPVKRITMTFLHCDNCNKGFTNYFEFKTHLYHCFKTTNKCLWCKVGSVDVSQRRTEHCKRVCAVALTLVCVHCGHRSLSQDAYRKHLDSCYISVIECSKCEFTSNVERRMIHHLKTHFSLDAWLLDEPKVATSSSEASSSCAQNLLSGKPAQSAQNLMSVAQSQRSQNRMSMASMHDAQNLISVAAMQDAQNLTSVTQSQRAQNPMPVTPKQGAQNLMSVTPMQDAQNLTSVAQTQLAQNVVEKLRNQGHVTTVRDSSWVQKVQVKNESTHQNVQEVSNFTSHDLPLVPEETSTLPEFVSCEIDDMANTNHDTEPHSEIVYSHIQIDPFGRAEVESYSVEADRENLFDIRDEDGFFMDVKEENLCEPMDQKTSVIIDPFHDSTFVQGNETEIVQEKHAQLKKDSAHQENRLQNKNSIVIKKEVETIDEFFMDDTKKEGDFNDLIEIKEELLEIPPDKPTMAELAALIVSSVQSSSFQTEFEFFSKSAFQPSISAPTPSSIQCKNPLTFESSDSSVNTISKVSLSNLQSKPSSPKNSSPHPANPSQTCTGVSKPPTNQQGRHIIVPKPKPKQLTTVVLPPQSSTPTLVLNNAPPMSVGKIALPSPAYPKTYSARTSTHPEVFLTTYTCTTCPYDFHHLYNIFHHTALFHDITVLCYCGEKFDELVQFKDHLTEIHMLKFPSQIIERSLIKANYLSVKCKPLFLCPFCGMLQLSNSNLSHHIVRVHKMYCRQCCTVYNSMSELPRYHTLNHKIDPTVYKSDNLTVQRCALCSYTQGMDLVKEHLSTHVLVDCESCTNSTVTTVGQLPRQCKECVERRQSIDMGNVQSLCDITITMAPNGKKHTVE